MYRTSIIKHGVLLTLGFVVSGFFVTHYVRAMDTFHPVFNQPLRELFVHSKHKEAFGKLGVRCTDCHTFAIKPKESGPVGPAVPSQFLQPPARICHQCHLGKVALARPNQCILCHANTQSLMPEDHLLSWRIRHGKMAQLDRQSCNQCHTTSSCSTCHLKNDTMNPVVHPPNFRLTHSIRVRADPQSCIMCHKSASFCKDCHTGGR